MAFSGLLFKQLCNKLYKLVFVLPNVHNGNVKLRFFTTGSRSSYFKKDSLQNNNCSIVGGLLKGTKYEFTVQRNKMFKTLKKYAVINKAVRMQS